jgi:DNA-binding LytR/AlgR family response regulator
MKLQCLIVDDEPMARKGISEDLKEISFIELAGVAENAVQAIGFLEEYPIDLVFLDIELPKLNGLDLVKTMKKAPMVIITTAYPQYAIEGYDLDVLDYLLKPIPFSRLLKACNKARDLWHFRRHSLETSSPSIDYFFVKSGGKLEKIFLGDLLFVEAADNYVILHTIHKQFLAYSTLKALESNLPVRQFIKVHKSYIVAIDKIGGVDKNLILVDKYRIPLSRRYRDNFAVRVLHSKMISR